MEKNVKYYWNKVAMDYFHENHPLVLNMLNTAERLLSKDEFLHLKELLKE